MKKIFTLFVVALMSVGMSFAEEINLTMDSRSYTFVYRDRLAQKNYWYFEASNGKYMVRLQTKQKYTQFAGSYVLDDMESVFLNKLNTGESITITAASFTASLQEGCSVIEGTLEGADGNTYIISLTYYYSEGIEDVAAEVKVVKRIVDGQLVIERDGKLYNATGAEVK